MGLQVVCLGAVYVDLLYRVENLEAFLEAWHELRAGGGKSPWPPARKAACYLFSVVGRESETHPACGNWVS